MQYVAHLKYWWCLQATKMREKIIEFSEGINDLG